MKVLLRRPTRPAAEEREAERQRAAAAAVEAQAFFTAVMTDTYLEPEGAEADDEEDADE